MATRQLGDAIATYHKILESDGFRDLSWTESLLEKMQTSQLMVGGRPVSPFLRPHFLTRKQYDHLVKAAESLNSAIDRVKRMALSNASLLSRMALLPAEKMLAQIDPGYSSLAVTSLLDTNIHNGTMQFVKYNAEMPMGIAYGEALGDLFYDAAPVKAFRKKYSLAKIGGSKYLLAAMLKAYKEFGGKKKAPNVAIVEFRQPFQTAESAEFELLAAQFRRQGIQVELVSPEQLDYRSGVLRRGDFVIDLVYRRINIQEFMVRFDLQNPLLRAYREGKVCLVNSFRSELARKKAIFDLLTDEAVTAKFPFAERKAIRDYIPWTRVVTAQNTTYGTEVVDLLEFIQANRERFILRPNDETGEAPEFRGWETDDAGWDRAIRTAQRSPYVVQERVVPTTAPFPVLMYGQMEIRDMNIEVHPHSFLGKVQGCSTYLTGAATGGYSTASGVAPTFVLESR